MKSFQIHKALLSSKSTYFRAAFESGFREAIDKQLHLAEENSECFSYYMLWIYDHALESINGSNNQRKPLLDDYCQLYVLADKLGSEALQNLVIDIIHEYAVSNEEARLDAPTINFVWANTTPGSQLRSILVDLLAWQNHVDGLEDLAEAEPEFLVQVLKITSGRLPLRLDGEQAPFDRDICKTYHTHRDGSGSCSCPKLGGRKDKK